MKTLDTNLYNKIKWFIFASILFQTCVYFTFDPEIFKLCLKWLTGLTVVLVADTIVHAKSRNTPENRNFVKAINYTLAFSMVLLFTDVFNNKTKGIIDILTLQSTWIFIVFSTIKIRSLFYWESNKNKQSTWAPQDHLDNDGIDTPKVLSEKLNFKAKGLSIANQIITNSQIKSEGSSPYQSYAILGDWGSGKSFLLNEVLNELHKGEIGKKTHVIHINPWQFQTNNKSAHLTEACLQQIRDDLDKNFFIPFIHISFHKFIHKVLPTIAETGLTSVIQQLLNFIPNNKEPRDAIQEAINATGRHIILIIDDIDRLSSSEAHDIFRFTRATLNFKNMSVIMCLDKEKTNIKQSDTYFQKVIHHEFVVPYIPYERLKVFIIGHIFEPQNYYKEGYSELKHTRHDGALIFMKRTEDLLEQKFMQSLIKNVRHAKKLILTYDAYKDIILASNDECKGYFHEINLADWLCLQSIRMHSSEAYTLLENSLNIERDRYQSTIKTGDTQHSLDSMNQQEVKAHINLTPEIQDAVDWIDSKQSTEDMLYSNTNTNEDRYKFNNPRYKINYFSYSKERGWTPSNKILDAINDKRKTKNLEQAFIELSNDREASFLNTFQYLKDHKLLKIETIRSLYNASLNSLFNVTKHSNVIDLTRHTINSNHNIDFLFNPDSENLLVMAYLAVKVLEDNSSISSTKHNNLLYKILESDIPYFTDEDYLPPTRLDTSRSFKILNSINSIDYNDQNVQKCLANKVVDSLISSPKQMHYVMSDVKNNRDHLRYITNINSHTPLKRLIDFITSKEFGNDARAEEYCKHFRSSSGDAIKYFKVEVGISIDSYISLKLANAYNQTKPLATPDSSRDRLNDILRSMKSPEKFDINGHTAITSSDTIEESVLKEISNEAHNIMNGTSGTGEQRAKNAHDYLLKCEDIINIIEDKINTLAGNGKRNYTTASERNIVRVLR